MHRPLARLAAAFIAPAILAASAIAAHAESPLSAGAGRASIDIDPSLLPLQGFSEQHDKTQARVLLLVNGTKRVALVDVDLTSISEDFVARLKEIVGQTARVQPENILVTVAHTFSAPHVTGPRPPGAPPVAEDEQRKDAEYKTEVETAVRQASETAARGVRPAELAFGTGRADVNVNRNMLTADGWWLGADDSGPSDKSVGVLSFVDQTHHPIAVLVNYAVQSSIMDQSGGANGTKGITADLGGTAVEYVESQYGDDTVAMFLVGAAGDQAPTLKAQRFAIDKAGKAKMIDIGARAYPLVDMLGERLGEAALKVSQQAEPAAPTPQLQVTTGSVKLDAQERPRSLAQIQATKTYKYNISGKADAPYYIMIIGNTVLIGVQVEFSSSTGEYIKRHSPFKNTIIMTMVGGAAKYLPDAAQYRQITYESMNSSYGPGSAEIFARSILRALDTMHKHSPA